MGLPHDYSERVYAGVLGKIIGVYLGRPFEGWPYEKILAELGEIKYYVNDKMGVPLVVTDDDISGTFTFIRALADYGCTLDLTSKQIGQTWLNYLIENKTVLWWGGLGNSTEHTAYLRLKNGIAAPLSGSTEMNGKVVAEQIGAQIFIDAWAMVSPGDPGQAADLAKRAASVSHDGEAIYGAQVLAAMEAQAFVESDIQTLIDTGISMIPKDSVIYRMVSDLREWNGEIKRWQDARSKLSEFYGYDKYGGNCHMVPNHGLIILGLLYGEDDFQKTLMITNTCGWDTDCNSGNIGCLMGIKNGLTGIDSGPDWRGPVRDRLYLPTADGGACISDAVTESFKIINFGRTLEKVPIEKPKNGARYHFELPGSVQGFDVLEPYLDNCELKIHNETQHSQLGAHSLAILYEGLQKDWKGQIAVPTFISPEAMNLPGYSLFASPTIYSGQTMYADVIADQNNPDTILCRCFLAYYGEDDELITVYGPDSRLHSGMVWHVDWKLDKNLNLPVSAPIARIGFELYGETSTHGAIYLDRLTWDGVPDLVLTQPNYRSQAWRKAWVNGVDHFESRSEPFRLIQDQGTGLIIQGTREWSNYKISADVTPHMVETAGIAACVQGMRRYYALLLDRRGYARLVKELDGEKILDEVKYPWQFGETHVMELSVKDENIKAWIDSQLVLEFQDNFQPLLNGAVALVVKEGRTSTHQVRVTKI